MKFVSILFISIILLISSRHGYAQATMIDDISYPYLEKLIATAKENYPKMQYFQGKTNVAKNAITRQKMSWLDSFNFSYIYQPNNTLNIINPSFFNGYQLGLFINFGSLLRTPFNIKEAKEELKIAQSQQQEYAINIETLVKQRYFTYLKQLNTLKLETQGLVDAESMVKDAKTRYERSEISFEEYNKIAIYLVEHSKAKIEAETDLLIAKAVLEELVGKKLEEVQ